MYQWVDITTIDNATPFSKVRWKESLTINSNANNGAFSELSGLTLDPATFNWKSGTGATQGHYSVHRFSGPQFFYCCQFGASEGTRNPYPEDVYRTSVKDKSRATYCDSAVTIGDDTFYEVDFSLWANYTPLYSPYASINNPFTPGEIYVYADISGISLNKDNVSFKSTGGTTTVSVTTADDWSAVVSDNWITASALSGNSGTTVVSITAPTYSDTTSARTGTVTFTCGQDSVVLTVKQSKASSGGIHNIHLGATDVSGVYMGAKEVQTIYLGSQEVYSAGPAVITLKYKAPAQIVPNVAYTDSSWTATFSAETYDPATSAGTVTFIDAGSGLTIPNGAYSAKTSITEFIIPKKVTSIGEDAFQSVYGLAGTLTIPKTVTSIGDRAFYACSALTEVFVPDSVTSDLTECFQNCSSMTEVHLSSAMTAIGDNMCMNCGSLTGITIPEGVTSIGEYAFFKCPLISEVTIPASVTSIDTQAFSQFEDASALNKITFKGTTPPTTDEMAFTRVATAGTIYCPLSAVAAYTSWKNDLAGNIFNWTVEKSSHLPDKAFMYNYSAKRYNPSTRTFAKTDGQLFNRDIVLNAAPANYGSGMVNFAGTSAHTKVSFSTATDNPFNRSASATTFTMVYKVGSFTDSSRNLFGNRNSNYNYMVRGQSMHTGNSNFLAMTPSTNPYIMLVRVKSNGNSERTVLDASGNVLQTVTSSTIRWGVASDGIDFFMGGYESASEAFGGTFYWMYLSNEELTDAEVLEVIDYNENLE